VTAATTALAADPTAAPSCPSAAPCDTEATPLPKSSDQWQQFGGAVFPQQVSPRYDPKVSPTKVSADLYGTGFLNEKNGFAVGAICANPATSLDEVTAGKCDQPAAPGRGARVPVIYQYTDKLGEGPRWQEVYGPELSSPGADRPGFIGAVTWIGPGQALAVGGDGQYPRREQDPSTAANDVAGHARAWLYDHGTWSEISDQLPHDDGQGNPMRGLSAVRCPQHGDAITDTCVAGGYQQIWMYSIAKAGFTKAYTGGPHVAGRSPESDLENADGFRFRVRSFIFVPPDPSGSDMGIYRGVKVVALTSGCCANPADPPEADLTPSADPFHDPVTSHPTLNVPKALIFDSTKWYVRLLHNDPGNGLLAPQVYADAYRAAGPPTSYPNSWVGGIFTYFDGSPQSSPTLSVIATPGGPSQATGTPADALREPASRIFGNVYLPVPGNDNSLSAPGGRGISPLSVSPLRSEQDPSGDLSHETYDPRLASVRLNGGDGDLTGSQTSGLVRQGQTPPGALNGIDPAAPDGIIDWGVGELYTTHQGVAYTTTSSSATVPNPLTCPSGGITGNPAACQPDSGSPKQVVSQSLVGLPTYPLNAFVMTPSGVGWAVGDRGALERLGGNASAGLSAEPAPPALGAHEGVSTASPYGEFSSPSAKVAGTVPALASQPLQSTGAPSWVSGGAADPTRLFSRSPETVGGLVMSRDDSEGWAYGPGGSYGDHMVLDHYASSRWTRCDPVGLAGQTAPERLLRAR
jgi:hypothetical protein